MSVSVSCPYPCFIACRLCSKESKSDECSKSLEAEPKRRPRKAIRETVKKDLEINELGRDMIERYGGVCFM